MHPLLILLCAGRGKRMETLTDDRPKALVPVKDKPIVEHTAESFFKIFSDAHLILLTGYKEEKIGEWASKKPYSVQTVFNKNWKEFGPIISADTAMRGFGEGGLILLGNGDTLFSPAFFRTLTEKLRKPGIYILGSKSAFPSPDDMLLKLRKNQVLRADKRKSENFSSDYESSGMIIANGPDYVCVLKQVFREMAESVFSGKSSDGPWHHIIQELVSRGNTVSFIDVPLNSWWEFDTRQCIIDAEISVL